MLSKKSFLANERNVLAPLVRPTRGNVRDHIESHKSDRRPSYMPRRGLRRRRQRKTDLREIFGAAQFSTFSTASTRTGRMTPAYESGVKSSNLFGRATNSRSPCFSGIIRQFNSFVLPHWYQAVGSMVRVVGLGLIQNEHGVWCVRRKVPKRLEEAVARAMSAPKAGVSWLKESLRTKDEGQAKILSKAGHDEVRPHPR
jgi:hypothetical protein